MRIVVIGLCILVISSVASASPSFRSTFRHEPEPMPEFQMPALMEEMATTETVLWMLEREEEAAAEIFTKESSALTIEMSANCGGDQEAEKLLADKIMQLTSNRIIQLHQFDMRQKALREKLSFLRERFVNLLNEIRQAELKRMLTTSAP